MFSDFELSSHDETNTAEMIDQMFEEVLEYAGRVEKETHGDAEDCDSGADPCSESRVETEEKNDDVQAAEEEDELLNFPPTGILSPLSKSVEAVVTPLVRTWDVCYMCPNRDRCVSDVGKACKAAKLLCFSAWVQNQILPRCS